MAEVQEERAPIALNVFLLFVALAAAVVVFIPYAVHTSPLNAVMLNVPGDQGNWWHFLLGAPAFLAIPMVWLRLRSLFAKQLSKVLERRVIWAAAVFSVCGTFAVEVPFLLGRAGTSAAQRWIVIVFGYGIPIASGLLLLRHRRDIPSTAKCQIGLNAAYLANAAVCLPVYAQVEGSVLSKPGWLVMMIIVWPMLMEVVWIFVKSLTVRSSRRISDTH